MTLARSIPIAALIAAVCLSASEEPAAAQVGNVNKFSSTRAVINECSITTAFTTIPGMTRTFTLGGTATDEVVVMFQASWSGSAIEFDTGFVRLTIDGVVQPTNNAVPIFAGSTGTFTHGFNWISQGLAPGSHTARIQWRTDLGSTFCVDDRTLVVLHR
jgi:hypothetical protein